MRLSKSIKILTVALLSLEVMFTSIDFIITSQSGEVGKSELDSFNYLDIIQIILTIGAMYTVLLYDQFTKKIIQRDDPFNNAYIFVFVMFMVILQKYLTELVLVDLSRAGDSAGELIVIIRQTLMSIQLLFIQIPIRHNFSLSYIEG